MERNADIACLACGGISTHVTDSRGNQSLTAIRRRRECDTCKARFSTYETRDNPRAIARQMDKLRRIIVKLTTDLL